MKYRYVWLMWSSAFLIPWIILYLASIQQHREQMWWASVFMAPFWLSSACSAPLISGEFVEHRGTIHCVENSSLFESPRLKDIRVHSLATLLRLLRLPSARMGFESF
jgi:hypothetical protein